jgi:hypothetical protein
MRALKVRKAGGGLFLKRIHDPADRRMLAVLPLHRGTQRGGNGLERSATQLLVNGRLTRASLGQL